MGWITRAAANAGTAVRKSLEARKNPDFTERRLRFGREAPGR